MRRAITFTQAQVRRAVKAAASAGLPIKGVKVYPDGSIEVEIGHPAQATYGQAEKALAASWDDA
jgi:hypothetical protein